MAMRSAPTEEKRKQPVRGAPGNQAAEGERVALLSTGSTSLQARAIRQRYCRYIPCMTLNYK